MSRTELTLKICKECGKEFMPKASNKERYCTRDHYRPCPVCGKPVFAKYLSDPARCCSGACRFVYGMKNKGIEVAAPTYVPEADAAVEAQVTEDDKYIAEVMEQKAELGIEVEKITEPVEVVSCVEEAPSEEAVIDESKYERKEYVGTTTSMGFIKGHVYLVEIVQEGRGSYQVIAHRDETTHDNVDKMMPFSNKKMISKSFHAVR